MREAAISRSQDVKHRQRRLDGILDPFEWGDVFPMRYLKLGGYYGYSEPITRSCRITSSLLFARVVARTLGDLPACYPAFPW